MTKKILIGMNLEYRRRIGEQNALYNYTLNSDELIRAYLEYTQTVDRGANRAFRDLLDSEGYVYPWINMRRAAVIRHIVNLALSA